VLLLSPCLQGFLAATGVRRTGTLVGAVALIAACSSGGSTPSPAAAPAQPSAATSAVAQPSVATSAAATSAATGSAASGGPVTLTIAGFAYDPTPLRVRAGQMVSVRNSDDAEHTVTADAGSTFKSGDVAHAMTVTFRAPDKPGTYAYHCNYHASMHGTLVVAP